MKKMKKIILIIVILMGLGFMSCLDKQHEIKPKSLRYCMELKLVDGSMIRDTFNLYEGTELAIGQYRRAYGLEITTSCLFNLYGYTYRSGDDGFLRFGVIDYKIVNKIPIIENGKTKDERRNKELVNCQNMILQSKKEVDEKKKKEFDNELYFYLLPSISNY